MSSDSVPSSAMAASADDIAIRVENLGKCYQIYANPRDRLKQFLLPRLQRLTGQAPKQYFRDFWALKDVSFEVRKGETVGIIGSNGSGKSTLLQIICGTLYPSSGRVQTNGRIAALLELGSGFNPEFTGRDNVYMNAGVLGLSRGEVDARFNDIAAFADIGDFIDQPVKMYSSGMVVRLAFAVIVHVDADILVIDEALSVGDAFFTQKCMRFLRDFMDSGTVIFVSHDTGAVINLCQHAIWLNQGACEYQGTPKDAVRRYFAKVYESQQGESALTYTEKAQNDHPPPSQPRDMRLDYINATAHRNDIELFQFEPDTSAFGKGGGSITSVALLEAGGTPLSWVVGGENVILHVVCHAEKALFSPIVGFYVNDRLGQTLFGENTFNFTKAAPLSVPPGQSFTAKFEFRMPILPVGDYSITVALAEGTQQEHVQHHWIHEAVILKSHSTSVTTGLVGIPMHAISLSLQ